MLLNQYINPFLYWWTGATTVPRAEYRALRLPEALMQQVDEYRDNSNGNFQSTPEVIKAAIRAYLTDNEDRIREIARDELAQQRK
jgi:Arc/MetJ-type ribon-helix-helix transcriptional regulator